MACFTRVEIPLADTTLNRRARKALGLAEEGYLSEYDKRRVRVEAGVIKAQDAIRRVRPDAIVRRNGNELTVSVEV